MHPVVDLSDPKPATRGWPVVAGWAALAALSAFILRTKEGVALVHALRTAIVWYGVLGLLVWWACAIDQRWALWRLAPLRALGLRALLGGAAVAVWCAVVIALERWAVGPAFWRVVFREWPFQLLSVVTTYAAGVGIGLAAQSFGREHQRDQRALRLEVLAREAELTALKAQLQPHFLFNALNSVVALVESEPRQAKRMLMQLGGLLHAALDRFDESLVPLERELETIHDYFDIERIRFGDRITFHIDADDGARPVPVPPFLLQPIVENAIKHGVGPRPGGGHVSVTARLHGPRLRLAVTDTGDGPRAASVVGRGLALTQRRLQATYGGTASMQSTLACDGFTVTLDLPSSPHAA